MTDAGDILSLTHHTRRLLLRPLVESDREEFVRVHRISEDHLRPWSPATPDHTTLGELFDERLERGRVAAANGTGARFGAFARWKPEDPDHGRLIGLFNLNNIARGVFQNADAGWLVSADCINQGFATEGVTALLDIAFLPPPRGLGLHRVQANIIPTNTASLKVAVRAGFRAEGLATRMLNIAGQWQDHLMFAKLSDEHTPACFAQTD